MTDTLKQVPRGSLLDHARRIAAQVDDADAPLPGPEPATLGEFLAEPTRAEILASTPVSTLIALVMLNEVVPERDLMLLSRPNGVAMVVHVPGAEWVTPVTRALNRLGESNVIRRAGTQKHDKPGTGNTEVADALAAGHNQVGVSPSPSRYLPATLVAAADRRIALTFPSNRTLRAVITFLTHARPGRMPRDIARGLSLDDIVSCIRRGSTASACVKRLMAASKATAAGDPGLADVPLLGDMHGLGEAGRWGLALADAISEYKLGKRSWSSIENRNIVLSGPAGTGKTSFARSLAKTTGLPLFATSVSQWFASSNGYLNDVVKAVDEVISRAVAAGPAILLLDEIDSIPNRATVDSRHRDFWVPVVSHILLSLDSAVSGENANLIVVGATNFPERLDDALVRPGRLDKVVLIERPDRQAIAGILRQHLGSALADEDLAPLAAVTAGCTGADLAGWVRGARMTARAAHRPMDLSDLIGQVVPPETRSPDVLLATARHESAHALAILELGIGSIESVSIVAQGAFEGRTTTRLIETRAMTGHNLDALVIATLAGRAADERWGGVTAGSAGGAGSDLAHATTLIAQKHCSWGLGSSLTYRGGEAESLRLVSADPAFRDTVESDLSRLYGDARNLVDRRAATIDTLARRLLERRVMGGEEVREVIGQAEPGDHGLPKVGTATSDVADADRRGGPNA